MRLASIDIGSNGARLLIKNFRETDDGQCHISRVMYMRVPLRLGADVFTLGNISHQRAKMMKHMMKAFKQIMKLNQVDDYRACATSAMRDATNGARVMRMLKKDTGIELEIIKGREEALLLLGNLLEQTAVGHGNHAYIDVGGGSTEITLLHDGQMAHSHSYNIGTLRMLGGGVAPTALEDMQRQLANTAGQMDGITIIGSGGNINKLYKLASHTDKASRTMTVGQLRRLHDQLRALTVSERQEKYGLKADRADVIVPAAEIFLAAAEALRAEQISVPNISLADGIIDALYQRKYAGSKQDK